MTPELEQQMEQMVIAIEALMKATYVIHENNPKHFHKDLPGKMMKALDTCKDDLVYMWTVVHNANCEKAKDSMVIV